MNFNYFLFDLDNCLVEIPNIGNYFDKLLVETLKEFDVKRIPEFNERKQIWFVGKQYINLLESWGIETHQKFWKVLDLKDFKQRKKLIHDGRIMLFEDVLQVLKELYRLNKRMGIISNTPDNIIKYQLDYFKIKKYFDIVVGLGEDQTICKPEPAGINIVLNYFLENGQNKREKNFKRIQSEAIMIGDSIVDIISANRAKVKSCLILRKKHHYTEEIKSWEYQPNFIIDQLDEILKL